MMDKDARKKLFDAIQPLSEGIGADGEKLSASEIADYSRKMSHATVSNHRRKLKTLCNALL